MATRNEIELLIKARDEASRALDDVTKKIKALEGSTGQASAGMDGLTEHMGHAERQAVSMSHGWTDMAKGMLAAQAIMAGFNAVYESTVGLFEKGIKSIDDLRLAQASMASAAATNAPNRVWQDVYETSGRIVEKVYELDRAFIGTGDELLQLADSMVTFGMGIDLSTKKQQDQFVAFGNMLKMMTKGQDFQRQAYQEVRALMEGADVQGALLVKKLEAAGVNVKAMVPEWRAQGVLLEKIMETLPGYIQGSKEVEKTFQAQRSSLETITYKILREGLAPAYQDVTGLVKGINDSLMDQNGLTEKGKTAVDALRNSWELMRPVVGGIAETAGGILEAIAKSFNYYADKWRRARDEAEEFDRRIGLGRGERKVDFRELELAGGIQSAGPEGLKLEPGKGMDDSAMAAAEKLAKKVEALYDKIAIEAARKRGGDVAAEIEKARIDWVERNRNFEDLFAKGKVSADDRAEALLASEKVYQDEREKIIQKREQQIADVVAKIRNRLEEDMEKLREKAIEQEDKSWKEREEMLEKAAERAAELVARYRELERFAGERIPRPWDVPGEKERQKAEHDFIQRRNEIEAKRRKGEITEEGFGAASEANVAAYKARLAQIEDATDQSAKRQAALWEEMFGGIGAVASDLFFDAFSGKLKTMEDYFEAATNVMRRAWANFLSDMLTGWLETQARMVAKGGFSGLFGGGFSSPGGAIGITDISLMEGTQPLYGLKEGGVLPGPFVPFRAFAGGGIADRPTFGLIGEGGGPEAIIPLRGGRVPVELRGTAQAREAPQFIFPIAAVGPKDVSRAILEHRGLITAIVHQAMAMPGRVRDTVRGR